MKVQDVEESFSVVNDKDERYLVRRIVDNFHPNYAWVVVDDNGKEPEDRVSYEVIAAVRKWILVREQNYRK